AYNLFKSEKLPGATQLQSGTILVEEPEKIECKPKCLKTGRSFTVKIDVDLSVYGLCEDDKKEILDSVATLGKKIAEKIGYDLGDRR
ncbi:hypothetical protein LCGC14_2642570, partial [marine sediment metagenome]